MAYFSSLYLYVYVLHGNTSLLQCEIGVAYDYITCLASTQLLSVAEIYARPITILNCN